MMSGGGLPDLPRTRAQDGIAGRPVVISRVIRSRITHRRPPGRITTREIPGFSGKQVEEKNLAARTE